MRPLDDHIKCQLNSELVSIENHLNADAIAIISPIMPGLDRLVRDALDSIKTKRAQVVIIHDTAGGIVEIVERIVESIRHFYNEVIFIIPDKAMSAGTIFALSADRIMMDYFSRLGPIDPQIEKDGKLVPALAFLNQFERLNEIARNGTLTNAEYALLTKLDLGELYVYEQARELSRELLIEWLSKYKFKNWRVTETRNAPVTDEMRSRRAKKIADELAKNERWHSHGRGIEMATLINELQLKIEDFGLDPILSKHIKCYYELLSDYMGREKMNNFVHTKEFF